MEKCFVSSTRRDITPTFASVPGPYNAGLDLSVEPHGDAVVVRVHTAKLTYPVLSSFFDEVRAILEDGSRKLVLDLEAVSYIDSATIGCLVEIHRLVADLGGALRLAGLRRRVHSMLSMTGVDRFLAVHEDAAEALASFGRRDDGAHHA
jgi:anti-sigma B factor antagonist